MPPLRGEDESRGLPDRVRGRRSDHPSPGVDVRGREAAASSCLRTDGPDGGRGERGVRIEAPGRGEWPVPVRPESGLAHPISRPPRSRAAGSQALDSRPRPGYSLFRRGRAATEFATSDFRPSAKRKPINLIRTDEWMGYNGLKAQGYSHKVVRTKSSVGDNLLPLANRVTSLLKRWLLGTHQGAVRSSHLDYYLDEFTFRFNRRTSRSRGKLFFRLVQKAMAIDPVPAKSIVGGRPEV